MGKLSGRAQRQLNIQWHQKNAQNQRTTKWARPYLKVRPPNCGQVTMFSTRPKPFFVGDTTYTFHGRSNVSGIFSTILLKVSTCSPYHTECAEVAKSMPVQFSYWTLLHVAVARVNVLFCACVAQLASIAFIIEGKIHTAGKILALSEYHVCVETKILTGGYYNCLIAVSSEYWRRLRERIGLCGLWAPYQTPPSFYSCNRELLTTQFHQIFQDCFNRPAMLLALTKAHSFPQLDFQFSASLLC